MKNRILVVEDEQGISDLICMNLSVTGYEPVPVYNGDDAAELLQSQERFDLVLLDVMLPGRDGFSLIDEFIQQKIPVIYLTANADLESKIRGLKAGAEDYIVKPFEVLELLVRVEKVLERNGRLQETVCVSDLEINLKRHRVVKADQEIYLKPMEYNLLVLLVKNKNVALSREQILAEVWGSDFLGESRTVDVHIGQLRKKLDLNDTIRTIPKLGYRLEEPE